MPSQYPGALDSFSTNKLNTTLTLDDHPAHHNDLADAVNKIEAELGTNPSGAESTVAALLTKAPFFNVKAAPYNAVGAGPVDDSAAIQAALDAGYGTQWIPPGDYGIGTSLVMHSGNNLRGAGPGGSAGQGSRLVALPTLNGPIIKSDNIPTGDWLHYASIKDLKIEGADQISGAGIQLRRLGELTTIDRVMVARCHGHGIHIMEDSTPMCLGYLSVHNNGRGGSGSGVYIDGSIYTGNFIQYIGGDNNADALLWVKNLYRANLFLAAFKSERWGATPGNPYVIVLEDGNGGTLTIGTGRVAQGAVSGGIAILHNKDVAGSIGRFRVLGGIQFDEASVTYTNFYLSDDGNSPNKTLAQLRGRPFIQDSPYFEDTFASQVALELDGNVALTTSPGTKFGTATNQKMGFWNKTPVVQPAALTAPDNTAIDATYDAVEQAVLTNLRTRVNELEAKLQSLGLLA